MKRLVGLLIVLSLAATVHAGLDIGFSSDNGGNWSYTPTGEGTGTFSFTVAGVDDAPDSIPVGSGDRVIIPGFKVLNLKDIGEAFGEVTGVFVGEIEALTSTIEIKKGQGNENGNATPVLSGDLSEGIIIIVGTTASLYPTLGEDINWGNYSTDFSLSLQGGIDIEEMINSGTPTTGGTFSGSIIIPEPATIFVLAIGSVLFWKKR